MEFSAPDRLVPFRWPASWTDPGLLRLLEATPINCVVCGTEVARSARARGLAVVDWARPEESGIAARPLSGIPWTTSHAVIAVTDAVWPGVRMSEKQDDATAGPTGAPWVDANGWVLELARGRAPGKAVWLVSEPPVKDGNRPETRDYQLAITDAGVRGGRWLVTLDEALARDLAAGRADAAARWRGIGVAMTAMEKQRGRGATKARAPLAVVSTFSGANETMATEVLNLASRRNLAYRAVERERADLRGFKAVLYVDSELPAGELLAKLEAFTEGGGLLIAQASVAALWKAPPVRDPGVAGYFTRAAGKGRVAFPEKEWDDAYQVTLAAHLLMSHRNDPVRLFNSGTVACYCTMPPGGGKNWVQLISYAGREDSLTVGVDEPCRSARIHTLESVTPLKPVRRRRGAELPLPAFDVWAAIEIDHAVKEGTSHA